MISRGRKKQSPTSAPAPAIGNVLRAEDLATSPRGPCGEAALYDGRHRLGSVKDFGTYCEARTDDGSFLGRFPNSKAAHSAIFAARREGTT
jgi:hypothetical protein